MSDDLDEDKIITVEMPLKDYRTMKTIINERQAYDIITGKFKTWWVWAVVGGVMTILAFWDVVKIKFGGS